MKIGIIGPVGYYDKRVIEIISRFKYTYGSQIEIVSGGQNTGIERHARKLALELELNYREFNPAYTPRNQFSALELEYYNRPWHPTHDIGRYRKMIDYCDCMIFFDAEEVNISKMIVYAEKRNKKIIKFNRK
jgi:hypothetical protein